MLSPKEITEKTFDKTFGFGYRMDDVDAYLEQIAASLTEQLDINADLEKKLEVLADKLTEYREDEESLRAALLGAQKLGDSVIRESKTKAEIVLRDATIKAEAMVNSAKRQIEREQESLEQIQKEVAKFKTRLLDLYKQHLALISSLPGVVEQPAPPAEPVSPAEPDPVAEEPDAEPLPPAGDVSNPDRNPDFDDELDDEDEDDADDESRFGELRFGEAFRAARDNAAPKSKK